MQVLKSSSFVICLSAILLILGTCLTVVEVPVRIAYEPFAAEQYDLMRAFMPLGIVIWAIALILLTYGVFIGLSRCFTKKPLPPRQRIPSRISAIVALALGSLAIASVFLPWVITERAEPLIAIRGGLLNVGQYHSLTGISIMTGVNSMAGDILLLVFTGAVISIVHIPLITLLEEKGAGAIRVFLLLLSGICIAVSIALIYAHRTWWISLQVNGSLGFSTTFKAPGIGLLTASSSAVGLMALGVITAVKSA
ncbi:MAG: hypothetical protein N3E36_06780 [Sulfolobales archaeon]|nr:hypothetical protein [Sulfolobales archaeon]MCX8199705.1 hypothetical protein [Sulfolobales archaeon]MDW8170659.1 hypothetical protein [Desulfurococcaceae archaeon]